MKVIYNVLRTFFIGSILFVTLIGIPQPATAKPVQVAVVPFKINAEKDLSFLRDGIVDMLSSRLFWEDKVTVINRQKTVNAFKTVKGSLNESNARKTGAELGADYVLFGSLTAIGNSVSIDAKMVDVSGKRKTLSFFNQSQGMDQVIPGINLFASDINEKEFGRVMPSRKVAAASQPAAAQTSKPQMDVRANPEKLLAGGFGEGELQESGQPSSPGSAFISTQMAKGQGAKFWKSRRIKQRITGIAIGDIDGDGKQETVITSEHSVTAYRYENKRFLKIKTLAERRLDHLIGVDIADINANGYPEIFVSALNPYRKFVKSFVIEFNGQAFAEIVKDSSWYYRVVKPANRGKILLGQKQGVEEPSDKPIYELAWQNSGYEATNRLLRGKRANVMGVAPGNVMNDGTEVIAAFDKLDYLRVYDSSGHSIWKSGEHSGGRPEYFEMPDHGPEGTKNLAYYPMRILVRDINNNGKNEVITVKNQRLSELLSFRKFTRGEIEIRSWNGIGLTVLWRTRKLSGYFSDFTVGDFDNDGQDELVAALVMRTGSAVTTTPKSVVIAYEIK